MADTEFVRGADRLLTRIATIRANIGLPALTEEIGQLLLRRNTNRFDKGLDPDNRPWTPLAEATTKQKLYRRQDAGILKRTLDLRNSIKIIRAGRGAFASNTGAGVRIGIDDPKVANYARVQQTGTQHIPARRILGIGRLDVKAVDSLMRRKAAQLESL